MNAKSCLFCVIFLSCCSFLHSQETGSTAPTPYAQRIPGGIVSQKDKGKDIFYYDFASGKTRNLTEKDQPKPDIFAISENGTTLLRASKQDLSRLKLRKLPFSEDQTVKTIMSGITVNNGIVDYMLYDKAENLTISPKGDKFSFERDITGKSLVRVPPRSPMDREWFLQNPSGQKYANIPLYICQNDIYHGVHLFTILSDLVIGNESGCGSSAFFPPVVPYRFFAKDFGISSAPSTFNGKTWTNDPVAVDWPTMTSTWKRHTTLTPQESVKRFTVKRNAYSGVWSKDNELFAAFYQEPRGYYIEINDSTPVFRHDGKGYERWIKGLKPGYYELLLPAEICGSGICGLAWKQDGSLTCQNKEGKVYSISHSQIKKIIDNSGLGINPDRTCYLPIPVNNTSFVTGSLVAENIYGSRICWTSDQSFIFRNGKGELILWNDGTTEKLLSHVPETFFYCNTAPPAEDPVKIAKKTEAKHESVQETTRTPDETLDVEKKTKVIKTDGGKFYLGAIKIDWSCGYDWSKKGDELKKTYIFFKLTKDSHFVIMKNGNLDTIKDPIVYRYTKVGEPDVTILYGNDTTAENINIYKWAVLGQNDVIIFEQNDSYAAIKVILYEFKYHSLQEVPQRLAKNWRYQGFNWALGPYPEVKSFTCECKFWPNVKPKESGDPKTDLKK